MTSKMIFDNEREIFRPPFSRYMEMAQYEWFIIYYIWYIELTNRLNGIKPHPVVFRNVQNKTKIYIFLALTWEVMLPLLRFYCPKWLDNGQISSQSKLKQSFSMNKNTVDKAEGLTRFHWTKFQEKFYDSSNSRISSLHGI